MVDGGPSYLRRSVNKVPYLELSVSTDDDISKIREVFKWGTYGKDGKQEKKYVLLKDLTDEHISAILDTQWHLPEEVQQVFMDEQCYRVVHDCCVKE